MLVRSLILVCLMVHLVTSDLVAQIHWNLGPADSFGSATPPNCGDHERAGQWLSNSFRDAPIRYGPGFNVAKGLAFQDAGVGPMRCRTGSWRWFDIFHLSDRPLPRWGSYPRAGFAGHCNGMLPGYCGSSISHEPWAMAYRMCEMAYQNPSLSSQHPANRPTPAADPLDNGAKFPQTFASPLIESKESDGPEEWLGPEKVERFGEAEENEDALIDTDLTVDQMLDQLESLQTEPTPTEIQPIESGELPPPKYPDGASVTPVFTFPILADPSSYPLPVGKQEFSITRDDISNHDKPFHGDGVGVVPSYPSTSQHEYPIPISSAAVTDGKGIDPNRYPMTTALDFQAGKLYSSEATNQ